MPATPRPEPTVFSQAVAIAVVTAAMERGRAPEELCRSLGVDPAKLADPGARLPHSAAERAWTELSEGADDFGLQAARRVGTTGQSLAEYAMLNAPNVRAALGTFVSLKHLMHDAATHSLEVSAAGAVLRLGVAAPLSLPHALWDFLAATMVARLRAVAGEGADPIAVSLPRGPFLDETAARAALGAPITYRSPPSMRWPREILERRVPSHDPRLYLLLTRQLDAASGAPETSPATPMLPGAERDLLIDLRRALRAAVLRSDASVSIVARQLGLSSRSLQRRLAERGTTFAEQLDEARRAVALAQLEGHDPSVKRAALTAGFSEVAAFSRAFRRWTGQSPATWLRSRSA